MFTTLRLITEFLLGRKYYANIVGTRGTTKTELSSYIFTNKEDAREHARSLYTNRSYNHIETITFRSYRTYGEPDPTLSRR